MKKNMILLTLTLLTNFCIVHVTHGKWNPIKDIKKATKSVKKRTQKITKAVSKAAKETDKAARVIAKETGVTTAVKETGKALKKTRQALSRKIVVTNLTNKIAYIYSTFSRDVMKKKNLRTIYPKQTAFVPRRWVSPVHSPKQQDYVFWTFSSKLIPNKKREAFFGKKNTVWFNDVQNPYDYETLQLLNLNGLYSINSAKKGYLIPKKFTAKKRIIGTPGNLTFEKMQAAYKGRGKLR